MSQLSIPAGGGSRTAIIDAYPLQGSDDRLVRVTHDDRQFIIFRVSADLTVGQFTTWDVSGSYADSGHDWFEDRHAAMTYAKRATR